MRISDYLQIGRGITALIGGGGKTTLLYTLTEELRKKGRVILTTSTRIREPRQYPVCCSEEDAKNVLRDEGAVCLASRRSDGKLGIPGLPFSRLAALADFVLVEADGARMLPLKAHRPTEPVIPDGTERIVCVVGADGFSRPIREVCHCSERYAALADASPDAVVTPELAARVLLREGLGDRVFINKVESPQDYENARRLAELLHCPVVAGSLFQGVYVCLR